MAPNFSIFDTTMTTLISAAAQAAHKVATSLLSTAEVKIGQTIPVHHTVKEDDAQKGFIIQNLQGRNVFVSSRLGPGIKSSSSLGRSTRSVHGNMQCPDPRIHQSIRRVQSQGNHRHLCDSCQRCICAQVSFLDPSYNTIQ